METRSLFLQLTTNSFGFSLANNSKSSLRPPHKHLQCNLRIANFQNPKTPITLRSPSVCSLSDSSTYEIHGSFRKTLKTSIFVSPMLTIPTRRRTHSFSSVKCSYSNTPDSGFQTPLTKSLENLSFCSMKQTLSQLTPLDVFKWSGVLSVTIAATKWTTNLLFNPFFWMYFSWTWLFWPWFVAITLAIYGLFCLRKHFRSEANIFEQLAIFTSTFTWLTLVPPAHFNGYLEGWPFVFFFIYHYFFFFNVSVRKRLYGDLYPRPHNPNWDIDVPNWQRLLFCTGIMAGHWLAALEGPELHLIPGGWSNLGIWVLIVLTLFMQYHSTLYLANYSEKVVVPTSVVQFGPYRWVRHPIYASTMLLFVMYCIALQAPLSLMFIVAVCLLYYERKVKLEESLMLETFGERYVEYMNKVRCKFIPLVY